MTWNVEKISRGKVLQMKVERWDVERCHVEMFFFFNSKAAQGRNKRYICSMEKSILRKGIQYQRGRE